MQQEDRKTVKVDERVLTSGVRVEYYCTAGGPSVQECIDQVARIAADALSRKLDYEGAFGIRRPPVYYHLS